MVTGTKVLSKNKGSSLQIFDKLKLIVMMFQNRLFLIGEEHEREFSLLLLN